MKLTACAALGVVIGLVMQWELGQGEAFGLGFVCAVATFYALELQEDL